MSKIRVSVLIATFSVLQVQAQTSYDLAAKYRQVTTYEVRPGILMTADFGADGQVCEMVLQTNHYEPERIVLGSGISTKLENEVLEELVPADERGHETSKWLDPDSFVVDNAYEIKQDYENVSVETDGGISQSCSSGDEVIIIRWKHRGCVWETKDSITPKASSESPQSMK
jgi:hypothetical protein